MLFYSNYQKFIVINEEIYNVYSKYCHVLEYQILVGTVFNYLSHCGKANMRLTCWTLATKPFIIKTILEYLLFPAWAYEEKYYYSIVGVRHSEILLLCYIIHVRGGLNMKSYLFHKVNTPSSMFILILHPGSQLNSCL